MPPLISTTYRWARRISIAVLGGTVVLIGIVMIVFPGPAVVVIPAGLAILGLEFAFARRWLRKIKDTGQFASRWFFRWRGSEVQTGKANIRTERWEFHSEGAKHPDAKERAELPSKNL